MHDYVGASFYLLASWFGMYKNSDLSFLTFVDVLLYVCMKNACESLDQYIDTLFYDSYYKKLQPPYTLFLDSPLGTGENREETKLVTTL